MSGLKFRIRGCIRVAKTYFKSEILHHQIQTWLLLRGEHVIGLERLFVKAENEDYSAIKHPKNTLSRSMSETIKSKLPLKNLPDIAKTNFRDSQSQAFLCIFQGLQ